jgi:hypothetical protein
VRVARAFFTRNYSVLYSLKHRNRSFCTILFWGLSPRINVERKIRVRIRLECRTNVHMRNTNIFMNYML